MVGLRIIDKTNLQASAAARAPLSWLGSKRVRVEVGLCFALT